MILFASSRLWEWSSYSCLAQVSARLSFRKAHYSHQKGAIFECPVYFMYLCSRAPVRMSSCGERSRTRGWGLCRSQIILDQTVVFPSLCCHLWNILRFSKESRNKSNQQEEQIWLFSPVFLFLFWFLTQYCFNKLTVNLIGRRKKKPCLIV